MISPDGFESTGGIDQKSNKVSFPYMAVAQNNKVFHPSPLKHVKCFLRGFLVRSGLKDEATYLLKNDSYSKSTVDVLNLTPDIPVLPNHLYLFSMTDAFIEFTH